MQRRKWIAESNAGVARRDACPRNSGKNQKQNGRLADAVKFAV